MKNLLRLTPIVLFISVLFSVVHAAENADASLPAGSVIVPEGLSVSDVQQCILLAGTGRGWTVKEKAKDHVVLFLEQGGWRSLLTLSFDNKEVKIASNSGKPDKNGVIKKQALPSWLSFLKQDITKQMGTKAFAK